MHNIHKHRQDNVLEPFVAKCKATSKVTPLNINQLRRSKDIMHFTI